MGKLKIQLMDSFKDLQKQGSGGCPTNTPFSATVHEIYRKLGLCECVWIEKRT